MAKLNAEDRAILFSTIDDAERLIGRINVIIKRHPRKGEDVAVLKAAEGLAMLMTSLRINLAGSPMAKAKTRG